MQLELRHRTRLYTADDEDLGVIREFVVDPSTAALTHVLVEKGFFFTDDRVVPVEIIEHADGERATLAKGVDPAALPPFVAEGYSQIDEETRNRLDVPGGLMWRHPLAGYAGPYYPAIPIASPSVEAREAEEGPTRDVLGESELIGTRTPVVSTQGDKVGTVSEMHVDHEGELSHLVVDLGFLSDEKVLPAHWIETIDQDGVRLAVSNRAVESLETVR